MIHSQNLSSGGYKTFNHIIPLAGQRVFFFGIGQLVLTPNAHSTHMHIRYIHVMAAMLLLLAMGHVGTIFSRPGDITFVIPAKPLANLREPVGSPGQADSPQTTGTTIPPMNHQRFAHHRALRHVHLYVSTISDTPEKPLLTSVEAVKIVTQSYSPPVKDTVTATPNQRWIRHHRAARGHRGRGFG